MSTPRQPQQQAAHSAEQQLRRVITSANCLLWCGSVRDVDGEMEWNVEMWDDEAAQRFLPLDVPPEKSYSYAWYHCKPEEDRAHMERIGNGALRAGHTRYGQEYRCRQRDGQTRWMWEDVHVETLAPDRWELVGVCIDVTERKRAEERNSGFQSLGQRLNVATTDEEAARIVLRVADELIGWDACWLQLCGPGERQGPTLMMDLMDGERKEVPPPCADLCGTPIARQVLQEGGQLILRERDEQPDPDFIPFGDASRPSASILCVPIRGGSRVVGAMSVQSYRHQAYDSEDLNTLQALADYCGSALARTHAEAARHELEQQLRQSQKMEAVGRLAGGVAHDFNNMLAVITGYTELALLRSDIDGNLRTALQEIRKAGERAAALTRQLLAFSRKQLLAPQVLDLNNAVTGIHKMLRRIIGEDIELVTALGPSLGTVRADVGQLEQVLLNLVVNARDAMPQGGKITLETRKVDVTIEQARERPGVPPGRYVMLSVTDTGCGMEETILRHVFEPFFTTKEKGKGTGLGLATVYGIVQQSDGHIAVESEPGHGTRFEIYLPRLGGPAETEAVVGLPGLARGSGTVLLVEDEPMLRGLVGQALQLGGYRVLEAGEGEEAIRLCTENPEPIDLVVTDVVMPIMNGRELAERVAHLRPNAKVLYMSGYTDDAVFRSGVEGGGAAFLQKPFTPDTLLRKVREILA